MEKKIWIQFNQQSYTPPPRIISKLKAHPLIKAGITFLVCTIVFLFATGMTVSVEMPENISILTDITKSYGAADIKKLSENEFQTTAGHRVSPGFVSGQIWIKIAPPKNHEKIILDLGPEPIDCAELWAETKTGFKILDKTGRRVMGLAHNSGIWRDALDISEINRDSPLFIRIQSFDSIALSLRFFSRADFIRQTIFFSIIYAVLLTVMGLIAVALFLAWIFTHSNRLLCLIATTLSLAIYIINMTGMGHTFFYGTLSDTRFFSRLGYISGSIGFAFFLAFFLIELKGKNIFILILFFIAIISSILFIAVENLQIIYPVTIGILILGCIFVSIQNIILLKTSKHQLLTLSSGWIPLLLFVVIRQTLHLIRLCTNLPIHADIFDNDYYFGYSICIIATLVIYSETMLRNLAMQSKKFLQDKEQLNFLRTSSLEFLAPVSLMKNCLSTMQSLTNDATIAPYMTALYGNCHRIEQLTLIVNSIAEQEQDIAEVIKMCRKMKIVQTFNSCMKNFIPVIQEKNLDIETNLVTEEDDSIMIFPLFLETFFTNLLHHVTISSPENSKIKIIIEWDEEEKSLLYRIKSSATANKETDIAFNLVRRICNLYGGNLSISKKENSTESINAKIFQPKEADLKSNPESQITDEQFFPEDGDSTIKTLLKCRLDTTLENSFSVDGLNIEPKSKGNDAQARSLLYQTFKLSVREIEISELLFSGKSNKEIASKLFISTSTVATHIQHIYEKCGVTRRTEWVRLVCGN